MSIHKNGQNNVHFTILELSSCRLDKGKLWLVDCAHAEYKPNSILLVLTKQIHPKSNVDGSTRVLKTRATRVAIIICPLVSLKHTSHFSRISQSSSKASR